MPDVPILTGAEIVDTALTVVNGEPLHYREWFNQLHRAGYAVAGAEPLKVVCANLHRHPLVKRTGDGIYQRDADAMARLRETVADLRRRVVEQIDDPDNRDILITQLQRAERIALRYA